MINNLIVSGNIGRDPETFTTQSGTTILKFAVASTSGYGDNKKTSWVECVMFGKYADAMAPYIAKGAKICVSGEFSIETWDANDGTKRQKVQCKVNSLELMGGGQQQGGGGQPQQQRQQQPQQQRQQPQQNQQANNPPMDFDDDVPF